MSLQAIAAIIHSRRHDVRTLVVIASACVALGGCRLASLVQGGAPEAGRVMNKSPVKVDEVLSIAARSEADRSEARARMALDAREPYWPFRLGQLLAEADSLAAAETALQTSLARDSSYAPALSLLSKLYFGARRHPEAIGLLEGARIRGPMPDELVAGLAMHYDALDQPDRARSLMATLADPGRNSTRPARVFVMLRGETPDQAVREAVAAVGDEPKNAVHQNNFGITKLRAGDVPSARTAFLAAIDLNPRLPGPYYNLAILEKFYTFDDPAAKRWFEAYWERSHDDPDSLYRALGRHRSSDSDEIAKQGGAR